MEHCGLGPRMVSELQDDGKLNRLVSSQLAIKDEALKKAEIDLGWDYAMYGLPMPNSLSPGTVLHSPCM